eukprot:2227790-Alexandrium_andersonii.AAC.2
MAPAVSGAKLGQVRRPHTDCASTDMVWPLQENQAFCTMSSLGTGRGGPAGCTSRRAQLGITPFVRTVPHAFICPTTLLSVSLDSASRISRWASSTTWDWPQVEKMSRAKVCSVGRSSTASTPAPRGRMKSVRSAIGCVTKGLSFLAFLRKREACSNRPQSQCAAQSLASSSRQKAWSSSLGLQSRARSPGQASVLSLIHI